MNEDMKAAWLEITQMLGETTKEELDVFLRTWQRAVEAAKRQAIEQAEQEPWCMKRNGCKTKCEDCPDEVAEQAQPKQCWKCGDMDAAFQAKCNVPACGMKEKKREFVGLTDEMVTAAARALNKRQAEACGVDKNDHWQLYGDDIKEDARAALEAAHGIKEKT